MPRLLAVTALLLCCFMLPTARAQERPEATGGLSATALARRGAADSLLTFRTRPVRGGRLDVDAGVLRAAYRLGVPAAPGAAPEAASRAALAATSDRFGWAADVPDLAVHAVEAGPYSTHVTYRQTFAGLPVHNRFVRVSLDRAGRATMVLSGYAPHVGRTSRFDARPTRTAAEAAAAAASLFEGPVRAGTPELVVYPSAAPRLAWRLLAWAGGAEWEVLVNAHTGGLLHVAEQSTHAHPGAYAAEDGAAAPAPASAPSPAAAGLAVVDGGGLVFDPDPLTTAGRTYGGAYADGGDEDTPELTAQLRSVVLPEITRGADGLYRLEGPYARIDGSASVGGHGYTPPAETDPGAFRYTRAHDAFEAVNVYYHVDRSQRYLQSLALGRPIQQTAVRVNPHGLGDVDNSRYYPGLKAIAFGRGGVDDAEDADVIWHEYGHALLEASAPGLLSTPEGRALHEGWADYWAASYSRALLEEDPDVPLGDWRDLFNWDGNETWSGRRLDHGGRYPENAPCTISQSCDIYEDGRLWATTLMEVYTTLGRTVTDRLNLHAHAYLIPGATMTDAAEALLQADRDLYDGAHMGELLVHLGERGFVDPADYGPSLTHDRLRRTEALDQPVRIEVTAVAGAAPVEQVAVRYGLAGLPQEWLALAPVNDTLWAGDLVLPATPGTVTYYVEATDALGLVRRLPEGAPSATYQFGIGPDGEPPVITHDAIPFASLAAWPLEVVAAVEDDLGVDSVWVSYRLAGPDGADKAEGAFQAPQEADIFRGAFPVARTELTAGSTIYYRLHARDLARTPNDAALPADGWYSFTLRERGVLRALDFEGVDPGLRAQGSWSRGAPAHGLHVAHSGEQAWGTARTAPYPEGAQRSSLELDPLDLQGLGPTYLVFWHWHDFERAGPVEPGRHATATLWDGGNVKISTDGGHTWTVAAPEEPYNGPLASSPVNPRGDEPGFGGYSYGWRRVVVPLPEAPSVRVRFEFLTDDLNTDLSEHGYAGWYVDDVQVTTDYPVDLAPPVATALPPVFATRAAGQLPPPIEVELADDVGIAAVQAVYSLNGSAEDTLRLAMSTMSLTHYAGVVTPARRLTYGDELTYRIHVTDAGGHRVVYPAESGEPFRVEYRLASARNVLAGDVRATGAWQQAGITWEVEPAGGTAPDVRSSLVLAPMDLPSNAGTIELVLDHGYVLGDGLGGNVKRSTDGGATWTVLEPAGGYPAALQAEATHPMHAQAVFAGTAEEGAQTTFDLTTYAGTQLRVRIDFGATRALEEGEFWRLRQATLLSSTTDGAFTTPYTLALHPNFPDPFAGSTTVSFTLPEVLPVRLELFDLLGRRVATLRDGEHRAGTHMLLYDATGLASGVYLLRLVAGGRAFTETLVVVR